MRKSALLLAAAAVAATPFTASASADEAYEQQIVRVATGGCPSGFTSILNVDDTHVCVRRPTLNPHVYVSNTGCPAGYTEVGSTLAGQWVCVTI